MIRPYIYIALLNDHITFEAKASLGFSPSTNVEDITEEKMQAKFGQKLLDVSFNVVMVPQGQEVSTDWCQQ